MANAKTDKQKKAYATEQIRLAMEAGLTGDQASKLMKAGGPSTIRPALQWVNHVIEKHGPEHLLVLSAVLGGVKDWKGSRRGALKEIIGFQKDASWTLLYGGAGKQSRLSWRHQVSLIKDLGLGRPQHRDKKNFLSVLATSLELVKIFSEDDAALEAIKPIKKVAKKKRPKKKKVAPVTKNAGQAKLGDVLGPVLKAA